MDHSHNDDNDENDDDDHRQGKYDGHSTGGSAEPEYYWSFVDTDNDGDDDDIVNNGNDDDIWIYDFDHDSYDGKTSGDDDDDDGDDDDGEVKSPDDHSNMWEEYGKENADDDGGRVDCQDVPHSFGKIPVIWEGTKMTT